MSVAAARPWRWSAAAAAGRARGDRARANRVFGGGGAATGRRGPRCAVRRAGHRGRRAAAGGSTRGDVGGRAGRPGTAALLVAGRAAAASAESGSIDANVPRSGRLVSGAGAGASVVATYPDDVSRGSAVAGRRSCAARGESGAISAYTSVFRCRSTRPRAASSAAVRLLDGRASEARTGLISLADGGGAAARWRRATAASSWRAAYTGLSEVVEENSAVMDGVSGPSWPTPS